MASDQEQLEEFLQRVFSQNLSTDSSVQPALTTLLRRENTGVDKIGLTGLDPRFVDDPRFNPVQRKLAWDNDKGGDRGLLMLMASPPGPVSNKTIDQSGGWDSAPIGQGPSNDWWNGDQGVRVGYAADQSDQQLQNTLHKLAVLPIGGNMGTDASTGEGAPNYADDWMYTTAKSIVGDSKTVTPDMIKKFRSRLLTDRNHRAEMVY